MNEYFTVETEEGIRIDKYLALNLPDLSRSHVQKLIRDDLVIVNKKPVKANYRLSLYDQIEVVIQEPEEPEILPENLPLDILYEDSDVIIVNKPKQMVVHPEPL